MLKYQIKFRLNDPEWINAYIDLATIDYVVEDEHPIVSISGHSFYMNVGMTYLLDQISMYKRNR